MGTPQSSPPKKYEWTLYEKLKAFFLRHPCVLLFLIAIVVYNLNFRNINSIDTIPASLLPFAILNQHTLHLDMFSSFIYGENYGAFALINGHFYSAYPLVTPVLVTPLYILPYLALAVLHVPPDMNNSIFFLVVFAMEKISASIIASLSVVVFFAGMKKLVSAKTAMITSLIFAFGTSIWSINSQALWQHGLVALFLTLIFFFIVKNEEKEQVLNYIFLGLCSGLLALSRPSDMILVIPAVVYIFYKSYPGNVKSGLAYCLAAIVGALPFIAYNMSVFHSLFGGYNNSLASFEFDSQILVHFIGLLFSPNRGLFIFTPVALLAVFGILRISSVPNRGLRLALYSFAVSLVLEITVYAAFQFWWGGDTYGPRFLVGALPIFGIFTGMFLDPLVSPGDRKIQKRPLKEKILIVVITLFVIWSVFVQVVGCFYYPNGNWNDSPPLTEERLWNVTDTQILRTFDAGPIIVNPVAIVQNLERRNDIIDPSTDFAIRIGLEFNEGWGPLEIQDGQPVRAISNYSRFSVQYMKYSLTPNNCTLSIVASGISSPEDLQISVNNEFIGEYPVPANYTRINVPVVLKSSLRLGVNTIEFRVPDSCSATTSPPGCENSGSPVITIRSIKITKDPVPLN
jgi:hypothetical protein